MLSVEEIAYFNEIRGEGIDLNGHVINFTFFTPFLFISPNEINQIVPFNSEQWLLLQPPSLSTSS